MRSLFLKLCFCLLFCALPALAEGPSVFDVLYQLDGKSYSGGMTYPADSAHPMNKPMRITVEVVSENEVRVPFAVGEDRSRTWILRRSSEGISLKHDHRHSDGTPDEVTNYGGVDRVQVLGRQLVFPADEETKSMLPEAATNVWSLRLSPDGKQLYYYLERHKEARFEAHFDLSREAQP